MKLFLMRSDRKNARSERSERKQSQKAAKKVHSEIGLVAREPKVRKAAGSIAMPQTEKAVIKLAVAKKVKRERSIPLVDQHRVLVKSEVKERVGARKQNGEAIKNETHYRTIKKY